MSNWVGLRYGRLLIIGDIKLPKGLCRCDCGNEKYVNLYDLRNGKVKSCGCLKREMLIKENTTHGLREHRLYGIWANIKTRCNNPNADYYSRYGGRGITISDEWNKDFMTFYEWSIENGYTDELTIDRINNDGNYEPFNCRWVDMKTQCRNKSDNKLFTINNITKPLVDWCEDYNINYNTVQDRLLRGWNIKDALSKEVETKYNGGGV